MSQLATHLADMFDRGGPVIWAILAFSTYGMTLVVERWFSYRAAEQEIETALHTGEAPAGPYTAPILLATRREEGEGDREILTDRVRTAYLEGAARIERRLGAISVIGALLPMLGILGTVVGMIAAFNAIALHGTGDPKILADGVSQALLTTEAGLITSIPLLYLHQVLVDRADRIARRLDLWVTLTLHRALKG